MTLRNVASHPTLAPRATGELMATRLLLALHNVSGDPRVPLGRAGLNCTLDEFLDTHVRTVTLETLIRVCACTATALADLATERDGRPQFRNADWRLLFYCLISARSLREAIRRGSELFRAVDGRCGSMTLHEEGDIAEIRFDCVCRQRSAASFFVDMFGLANMHGVLNWLIAHPLPVQRVLLNYSDDMLPLIDYEVLPAPVTLNSAYTALQFPAQFLDFPVVRTNEDCDARISFTFLIDMPDTNSQFAFAEHARRVMYRVLRESNTTPALPEISASLGVSQGTFRRYLKSAGLSYNQIKDSCRRELGLDLLRRSTLSIEEISDRLGFCDSDAFRRSFNSWFGISPSQYRKRGMPDNNASIAVEKIAVEKNAG